MTCQKQQKQNLPPPPGPVPAYTVGGGGRTTLQRPPLFRGPRLIRPPHRPALCRGVPLNVLPQYVGQAMQCLSGTEEVVRLISPVSVNGGVRCCVHRGAPRSARGGMRPLRNAVWVESGTVRESAGQPHDGAHHEAATRRPLFFAPLLLWIDAFLVCGMGTRLRVMPRLAVPRPPSTSHPSLHRFLRALPPKGGRPRGCAQARPGISI